MRLKISSATGSVLSLLFGVTNISNYSANWSCLIGQTTKIVVVVVVKTSSFCCCFTLELQQQQKEKETTNNPKDGSKPVPATVVAATDHQDIIRSDNLCVFLYCGDSWARSYEQRHEQLHHDDIPQTIDF